MSTPAFVESLRERIDGMPLRQRALLAVAVVALVFLVVDTLMIRPQAERRAAIQQDLEQVDGRVQALNAAIEQLARRAAVDPDAQLRERLESLEVRITAVEEELSELGGGLARPDDALELLRGLLSPSEGLRLERLEKLPAEPLAVDGESASESVWIHRYRVVIAAEWSRALDYLGRVESLPSGLYLETMNLSSADWPVNRLELVFYTLAVEEDWLDV
ncbi:MAG: hypothetical protein R3323_01770 [Wenzhouxiangellaceae bacterium]|nr:hypothetical protein [Wenzhouxiangellaceae bacterium]